MKSRRDFKNIERKLENTIKTTCISENLTHPQYMSIFKIKKKSYKSSRLKKLI